MHDRRGRVRLWSLCLLPLLLVLAPALVGDPSTSLLLVVPVLLTCLLAFGLAVACTALLRPGSGPEAVRVRSTDRLPRAGQVDRRGRQGRPRAPGRGL